MNEDLVALAKLRLEEMLTFFGVNVSVRADQEGDTISLDVEEADTTGRLIGHHGETLASFQQLLNAMIRDRGTERLFVTVDIGGYKKARAEYLREKVKSQAEQVIETGEPKFLRPMTASERRIVHMALADVQGIETESEGEGRARRVVIRKKS